MIHEKDKIKPDRLRISRTALPDLNSERRHAVIDWKAEQFLKVIQEDALELIFVVKLDGSIKYVNDAVKGILGYDQLVLKKKGIQRIIPIRQWVSFRAAMRASQDESERGIQMDTQFILENKQRKHFALTIKDLRAHPLVEGFVIHAKNIDKQKRQEESLRLQRLAMQSVEESLVVVCAKPLKITYANAQFFEMSGFNRLDILGKKINIFKAPYSDMLFTDPTPPKIIQKFQNAIKEKRSFRDRIYSKKKNGEIFYNRIGIRPVLDFEGNVKEYVVSMKEIKPRKRKSNPSA